MKRRELMAIVALAAGLSVGLAGTPAFAGKKSAAEHDHPGHSIGQGHTSHGNGNGYGHEHHDHVIY
jgi:hypothetical protein